MNKNTKLSVSLVIPAYNEENQLYGCLSAIENQVDMPDEVIVVNNNSSDSTAAIARSFSFVKLIYEPRQGLRYTRNTGVAQASGDIVGRIDADTRLTPDWVANVRKVFSENPELMAATGPAHYHDMPLRNLSLAGDHFLRNSFFKMQRYPLLYGSNMAFRSSAWQKVLPKLCQDGEFFEDLDMTIHFRELNCLLGYYKGLAVGVSARRMNDSPRAFYRNSKIYNLTFWRHDQRTSLAASGAKWIFLALYPISKAIRLFYRSESLSEQHLSPRPTSNT